MSEDLVESVRIDGVTYELDEPMEIHELERRIEPPRYRGGPDSVVTRLPVRIDGLRRYLQVRIGPEQPVTALILVPRSQPQPEPVPSAGASASRRLIPQPRMRVWVDDSDVLHAACEECTWRLDARGLVGKQFEGTVAYHRNQHRTGLLP